MIWENIKILFKLYLRPQTAMGDVIDRGSLLFGAIAVILVSLLFQWAVLSPISDAFAPARFSLASYQQFDRELSDEEYEAAYSAAIQDYQRQQANRRRLPVVGDAGFAVLPLRPTGFFTPIVALAVFYVPIAILLITIFAGLGNFGRVFSRDYSTLLTCTLMAWTAATLPFAVAGLLLRNTADASLILGLWAASALVFGVLMTFALRTVFGANFGAAVAAVGLSWLGLGLGASVFNYVSPFIFSPFILLFAFLYFRGNAATLGEGIQRRQSFRRYLNAAAINPRDAEAQYQLGLIYEGRRQDTKAREHFQRAVEIDPNEPDANYSLGKIARAENRLQDALNRFAIVVEQNDKHQTSEVWREIGATYLAAGVLDTARESLEKFVERRPFDAEGLYYLGQTYKAEGKIVQANEIFQRAVESVQTAPDYRRREERKWSKLAEKQLTAKAV